MTFNWNWSVMKQEASSFLELARSLVNLSTDVTLSPETRKLHLLLLILVSI